jgi:uncharacterized membrane protein
MIVITRFILYNICIMEIIYLIVLVIFWISLNAKIKENTEILSEIRRKVNQIDIAQTTNQNIVKNQIIGNTTPVSTVYSKNESSAQITSSEPQSNNVTKIDTAAKVENLKIKQEVSNIKPTSIERIENPKVGDGFVTKAVKWLFKDFILKIGGVMVVLGLIFLLNIGIEQQIITESMRVFLALMISSAFVLFGHLQVHKNPLPGQVLFAIGSIGYTLTTLGARHIFHFISADQTLVFITIIQLFSLGFAYYHKKQSLACVGLLVAGIAPFIIGSDSGSATGLLTYGLVLFTVMLPYIYLTQWKIINTIALYIGLSYSGALLLLSQNDRILWILLYLGLFNFGNLFGVFQSKKLVFMDLLNALLISILSIIWIGAGLIGSPLRPLILAGVAMFYVVSALILNNRKIRADYTQLQFLSGMVSFGFALIFQYSNFPALLSLLLFAEISITLLLCLKTLKLPNIARIVSVFNFVPLVITLTEYPQLIGDIYSRNFGNNLYLPTLLYAMIAVFLGFNYYILKTDSQKNEHRDLGFIYKISVAAWIVTIIFVLTGLLVPPISGGLGLLLSVLMVLFVFGERKINTEKIFNNLLLFVAGLAGFRTIWTLFEYLLPNTYSVGVILAIYSIIALVITKYSSRLSHYGKYLNYVIFGFVVVRLFLVEFWQMPIFARFVTFIGIGLLFIATPYLQKNSKEK